MTSSLLLAFALGIRHGVDPDHLTAIDGLSRVRPRAVNGLYFALGHGLVVTALTAGIGGMLVGRTEFLGPWALLAIGTANLCRLLYTPSRSHSHASCEAITRRLIARPLLLGMILAAGFETSSQLSVLVLAGHSSAWLMGLAFSAGMVIVDGVDGYLAASTQGLAASGATNARAASRWMGFLVVAFSFGLAGAELAGIDVDGISLPLGLGLFLTIIGLRVWARRAPGTSRSAATSEIPAAHHTVVSQ